MTRTLSAREQLLTLSPFPTDAYAGTDLNRLTAYTIHRLRALDVPTSIENIAVANHRMFPRRFAMVGFPEFPDVSRVNRALLQLRPKYRNWATGNASLGWALTRGGVAEAEAVAGQLENKNGSAPVSPGDLRAEPSGVLARTLHGESSIARLRATSLFEKFKDGWRDVNALELFDVLEAYTHTPPDVLRSKVRQLKTIAADMKDLDVQQFLDELPHRFPTLFRK